MKKKLMALALMGGMIGFGGMAQADGKGAELYKTTCAACHATGAAGAPKFGDKAAWGPRLAQGIDGLVATAKNGKGAMPPMGTCMKCSEEDLKAIIEYMVSAVQ